MPLYEYDCLRCRNPFETLRSFAERDLAAACPRCQTTETRRKLSRFAVGGQGDLRESTLHGCHDAAVGHGDGGHDHGPGHGHGHGTD